MYPSLEVALRTLFKKCTKSVAGGMRVQQAPRTVDTPYALSPMRGLVFLMAVDTVETKISVMLPDPRKLTWPAALPGNTISSE